MNEPKTCMEETQDVEAWEQKSELEITQLMAEAPTDEITASVPVGLRTIEEAKQPSLSRQFKDVESFMSPSGVMMLRDRYYVLPTAMLNCDNPDAYSLGYVYGEAKPKGRLFSGKNRKERRAEEVQARRKSK